MTKPRFARTLIAAFIAGTTGAILFGQEPRPVFRVRATAILVNVFVRDGRSPLSGLTKADFQLFDQGIPQEVDAVHSEQLPVDLTIVLDASGSTSRVIPRFTASAAQMAAMLRADDRVRIVAFGSRVAEVMALTNGRLAFEIPSLGDGTALNDALLLSLARARAAGRRHLIVAYTDGIDTASVLDQLTVSRVARQSASVLHLVLSAPARGGTKTGGDEFVVLREIAESTGGGLSTSFRDAVEALHGVLSEFRQSYVLQYTPRGVPERGWHELSVRLNRPDAGKLTVHARQGYFAAPE